MKARTAYLLIALFVAGTAGIAWAAQPAVDQSSTETPAIAAPAQDGVIIPAELDGLLQPAEQGACCRADCFAEYIACKDACDLVDTVCKEQCVSQRDACYANC